MFELNDSVFFMNGEGLYIELDTSGHSGYYDIRGIEALLVKAMQTGESTDELEEARSTLQAYHYRMGEPSNTLIPHTISHTS